MLYTRKGDDGLSGLFGTKVRFSKDSQIYEALGTIDELNSLLGVCRAAATSTHTASRTPHIIHTVQECLFIIQAEIAGADHAIHRAHITGLETTIAEIEDKIKNPHAFIIPGTTLTSALFDFARSVARRAERSVISIQHTYAVSSESRTYLNRLSSLLYALARATAAEERRTELSPSYNA